MSSDSNTIAVPTSRNGSLRSFFELGKFKIFELWLGFFVGVTLIPQNHSLISHDILILGLILFSGISVIAATCALDDITGVRDGVDQANHQDNQRYGVNKPILDGRLSEYKAFHFIAFLGIVIISGLASAMILAWPRPLWFVLLTLALILVAVNYSWGLKLSYHGAGEFVVFLGGAGTVLVPYGLIADNISSTVLVLSFLVGIWNSQIVVFSNSVDKSGDLANDRMTIAARSSKTGNYLFICTLFFLSWLITALSLVVGWIAPSYLFVLLPIAGAQAAQLWIGIHHEQWMKARLIGFRVLRYGIILLIITNLFFLYR